MKAILHHTYGSPDVLRYEDIEQLTASDDHVNVAALTALQVLRDRGHMQPGQNVLINSAA